MWYYSDRRRASKTLWSIWHCRHCHCRVLNACVFNPVAAASKSNSIERNKSVGGWIHVGCAIAAQNIKRFLRLKLISILPVASVVMSRHLCYYYCSVRRCSAVETRNQQKVYSSLIRMFTRIHTKRLPSHSSRQWAQTTTEHIILNRNYPNNEFPKG